MTPSHGAVELRTQIGNLMDAIATDEEGLQTMRRIRASIGVAGDDTTALERILCELAARTEEHHS